jgi:hypothetical protein
MSVMPMRSRLSVLAAFLIFASPARSATLDDLRRALAAFPGMSAMKVRVETQERKQSGKTKRESSASVIAEDDGTQLRLVHAKADLRRRLEKGHDDERGLEAAEALELMNYSSRLVRLLDGATLTKVTQSSIDGTAATLFEIVPVREKSERTERFVKSFSDVLLLWVAPGGIPIAAERTSKLKAGILFLNFESKVKETFRFARAADHLVVTRHVTELAMAGLGQDETGMESAIVAVLP